MKIRDYQIVDAQVLGLQHKVMEQIAHGWQPWERPFGRPGSDLVYQVMVKYQQPEEVDIVLRRPAAQRPLREKHHLTLEEYGKTDDFVRALRDMGLGDQEYATILREGRPVGIFVNQTSKLLQQIKQAVRQGPDDDVIVELTSTDPHGEHRILLVEDNVEPGRRIYRFRDSQMNGMSFTGEELMDLTKWFVKEQGRPKGDYK